MIVERDTLVTMDNAMNVQKDEVLAQVSCTLNAMFAKIITYGLPQLAPCLNVLTTSSSNTPESV
jgi:radical SAM superfamily enzyme with C-terminal helix-hairpin-helix motif